MMRKIDVINWLNALPENAMVGIDKGESALETEAGAYLEVGELPEPPEQPEEDDEYYHDSKEDR